jgi:hypothetical protein
LSRKNVAVQLGLKTLNCVGWVEERNPTFSSIVGFRKASTQPTIILNTKRIASELETPTSELETPSSKLETPTSELETPSSKLETPTSELQNLSFELEMSSFILQHPSSKLKVFSY